MVSPTTSTCNAMRQDAQKRAQKFCASRRAKNTKRTRKSRKRVKPGAFWVLERGAAGADRCKRMQNVREKGRTWSRLPARSVRGRAPLALAHPTTRTARGADAPRCQVIMLTNEKSQVPQMRYLTFLAGAEGLEPSARGFGVDVGKRAGERGRASVTRFSRTSPKRVVLVWCCGGISGDETGGNGMKGATLPTERHPPPGC